jgi:hypothetical protein
VISFGSIYSFFHQHLHRLRACLNRLLGFLAAFGNFFICPADLAQYDLRLAALALVLGLLSVTAVFSLEPGFCLRYLATPFLVMPAPALVGRFMPRPMVMPFILLGFLFRFTAICIPVFII